MEDLRLYRKREGDKYIYDRIVLRRESEDEKFFVVSYSVFREDYRGYDPDECLYHSPGALLNPRDRATVESIISEFGLEGEVEF